LDLKSTCVTTSDKTPGKNARNSPEKESITAPCHCLRGVPYYGHHKPFCRLVGASPEVFVGFVGPSGPLSTDTSKKSTWRLVLPSDVPMEPMVPAEISRADGGG
jgi:hypothetical protein